MTYVRSHWGSDDGKELSIEGEGELRRVVIRKNGKQLAGIIVPLDELRDAVSVSDSESKAKRQVELIREILEEET
jgi:hypothetical protein